MSFTNRYLEELSTLQAIQLEQLLRDFDRAWHRGERPEIEAFLPDDQPQRQAAVIELVYIDLEHRLNVGESINVGDYLDRYPELHSDLDLLSYLRGIETGRRHRAPRRLPTPSSRDGLDRADGVPATHRSTEHSGAVLRSLSGPRAARADDAAFGRGVLPPCYLGRFEFLERVGAGSFGTVYKAHDRQLDRIVAVKLPRSGSAQTPEESNRLLREARSAGQLNHPAIVSVHDAGQIDGTCFLVSDFIHGTSLADQLRGRTQDFRRSAEFIAQVADALDYAHRRGVIHRDIKPANILLDAEGRPHVTDFGLAKRESGEPTLTEDGQLLGTPSYMSPEQARGEAHSVDRRSDIYSLGVVLYELLTGALPFRGNTRMLVVQVAEEEPRTPRRLNDEIPRDLENICLMAMRKEPAGRYGTAADFAADLRRFLRGEPVVARPIARPAKLWRWCRRNRLVASLAGVVAALVTLVAIVATAAAFRLGVMAERERLAAGKEREARVEAESARNRAVESAELSRQRQVRLNVANGVRSMDDGKLFSSLPWFVEALRLDQGHVDREAVHRMRLATVLAQTPSLAQIWFHQVAVGPAFSPDGSRIITADHHGTARVWEVSTGQPVTEPLVHERRVDYACFSPDGRYVATTSLDGTARVWDAATGFPVSPVLSHSAPVVHADFSPDGRLVATASHDRTARIWHIVTGNATTPKLEHPNPVLQLWFTPDGRHLVTTSSPLGAEGAEAAMWDAFTGQSVRPFLKVPGRVTDAWFASDGGCRLVAVSWDGATNVWNLATGKPIAPPMLHKQSTNHAAFSPDGRRIVTASLDETARVWETQSGEAVTLPLKHSFAVYRAAFSPDGRRVVTSSWDYTARVWDADSGKPVVPPLKHSGFVLRSAFSPDGRYVATASQDHTTRLWDLATCDSLTRTVIKHDGPVKDACFSPDGRRVASASDRTARVWDAATGEPLTEPLVHDGTLNCISFSSDGELIATADNDQTACIWDAATGELHGSAFEHTAPVNHVSFSPDGQFVVTACNDGRARVWEVDTGRLVAPLKHDRAVPYADFSPDGSRVVTVSMDGTARIWSAATGKPITAPLRHFREVVHASFGPRGRLLVTAGSDPSFGERTAEVWDAARGKPVTPPLKHGDGVLRAIFSPDGKWVLTASEDTTARVWDVATREPVTPPLKHMNHVLDIAFSPDGVLVATASRDGTARVWDAATGDPVTPPLRHDDAVNRAAFSPDGRSLLTASADGTAHIWNLPVDRRQESDLLHTARLLAGGWIDGTGAFIPVDIETLRRDWHSQRSR